MSHQASSPKRTLPLESQLSEKPGDLLLFGSRNYLHHFQGCGGSGHQVQQRARVDGQLLTDAIASDDRTVVADITSYQQVRNALRGQEAVVHLAGIPSYSPDHIGIMTANMQGTSAVLEAAADEGIRRLVFASSICAYGLLFWKEPWTPAFLPLDESHPCWPDEPYGLSKLLGDQMCAAYSRRHRLDTFCLRLAPVLFPGSEKNRMIFSTVNEPGGMAAQANLTEFGTRVTNASKLWSYVDVRDVAQAVQLALEAGAEGHHVYNIGAADVCSEKPSLDLVGEYYPDVGELRHEDRLIGRPYDPLYDIERATDELGFEPRHSWRELSAKVDRETPHG